MLSDAGQSSHGTRAPATTGSRHVSLTVVNMADGTSDGRRATIHAYAFGRPEASAYRGIGSAVASNCGRYGRQYPTEPPFT